MKNILMIEDDQFLEQVYEHAFQLAGYEVTRAPSGEDAVKRLSATEPVPSAIILDIALPKMNGFDVLTYIRGDARFKDVPVVVLTNSSGDDEEQRFLSAGADCFMVKVENEPRDVVRKLAELIQKGRGAGI